MVSAAGENVGDLVMSGKEALNLPHQVQINLQVLTAMIDFGLDPQQAAEMPRWT